MNVWEGRLESRTKQSEDARSEFDIDYARIIHSASFRRLQGKTQILNLGDSDFYRTRLTHSLEVSQIAMSIVAQLREHYKNHPIAEYLPSQNLIMAIGSAHDLGHPPFGHGGEIALNYCMRNHGGFEGNGQTLRILSKLEKFSRNAGANLTRRVLLGVLKYPSSYSTVKNGAITPELLSQPTTIQMIDREKSKPPKCYLDSEQDIVDWILKGINATDRDQFYKIEAKIGKHAKSLHKSFDCSIMDIADEIAYGIHDLEDAIALKLVTEEQFRKAIPETRCQKFLDKLKEKYKEEFKNDVYDVFVKNLFLDSGTRKRQIGRLVHHFVTHIEIYEESGFQEPLLKYRVRIPIEVKGFLADLQSFVRERVIMSPNVQHLEFKGQKMVVSVFEVLASEPKSFLPLDMQQRFEEEEGDLRVICDHIAGMTDGFLLKTYDRLFSPHMGSVFDKL